MKELQAICEAYKKIDFSKQKAVLATVVRVRGSAYRSPGARMLITDNGNWIGSISGGCLEGDALRKARKVMQDKKPITVTYDTREDDNNAFKINLGCNGIIDVLFEAVDPTDHLNPVLLFESLLKVENPVALATVFSGTDAVLGKKLLLDNQVVKFQNIHQPNLSSEIETDLQDLLATKRSRTETYEFGSETAEVFIELIQPPIHLMIFGGGFDARPVSQMAKTLGWSVTITDECVAHIAPVFFPQADNLSLCHREFVDRDFNITDHTACVLISHNFDYDRDVLRKLLKTNAPYIGIVGPKKRFDKMLQEFSEDGIQLTEQDWDRIHAPIGLDIGSETPEEIAVAIIAEIMGKFSKRDAGYLKFRNGPIHLRDTSSDQVFKEATI